MRVDTVDALVRVYASCFRCVYNIHVDCQVHEYSRGIDCAAISLRGLHVEC